MKCPYCAEEIQEEAIVCRYCRRDFIYIKPIEARLRSLEERLSEMVADLSSVTSILNERNMESHSSASELPDNRHQGVPLLHLALSTLGPVVLMSTLCYLFPYKVFMDKLYFTVSVFIPAPFGTWLGLKWSKSHLGAYALIGLLIGVLDSTAVRLFLGTPPAFFYYGYFAIPATLMFISSALFGDLIEKRLHPGRLQQGFAKQIAIKLTSGSKEAQRSVASKGQYDERVKRLAGFITALAPILVLLGTIVSGILTYLAAAKK